MKEAECGRRSFGSQSRRVWGRLKLENVQFGRAEFGERRVPEVPKLGMPNGRKAGCGERGFSQSTEVGPRPPSLPSGFHLEEAEFGARAGKGMEGRNGRSRRAEDGTRRPPTTRGHRCPRSRSAAPTHRPGTLRLSARIWAVPTALRPRMRGSEPTPVPQADRGRPRQRWDAELGGRSPPPSRSPAGGGADGSGTRSWGSQPGGGARRFAFLGGGFTDAGGSAPPGAALRSVPHRSSPGAAPTAGSARRFFPLCFPCFFCWGIFFPLFSPLFPLFPRGNSPRCSRRPPSVALSSAVPGGPNGRSAAPRPETPSSPPFLMPRFAFFRPDFASRGPISTRPLRNAVSPPFLLVPHPKEALKRPASPREDFLAKKEDPPPKSHLAGSRAPLRSSLPAVGARLSPQPPPPPRPGSVRLRSAPLPAALPGAAAIMKKGTALPGVFFFIHTYLYINKCILNPLVFV